MAVKDQHIEPTLMRLGSKADSRSVSVTSLASMARQLSDLGNHSTEVRAEYFSTGPGRSSSTSLDFSKTLPEAACAACDTPRLSTSMQEQHMLRHENVIPKRRHEVHASANSSMLCAAGEVRHRSSLARIQAGVPFDSMKEDASALHSAAAAAAMHFADNGAMERSLLLQQEPLLAPAAAAHTQDSSLWQRQLGSSTGAVYNQYVDGPTAMLSPGSSVGKQRRASCCVLPDSHYKQRLMQLRQLMEAEQQLQAELMDAQQQQLLGQQQQLQHLQAQHLQQQQQCVGTTAGSRRRRASYSVSSSADCMHLQRQQQQHLYLGSQVLPGSSSSTVIDDVGSLRNQASCVLDPAVVCSISGLHRSSMDVRGSMIPSDIARIKFGSNRASLDLPWPTLDGRGLPTQLHLLLQQQQQDGMAANAVQTRKQRRASCCVGPDRQQYQQQLQQLHQQLHIQEQQLAQEQQVRVKFLQAQQLQQQVGATAGWGCRQRRASCCALPSAHYQPQAIYDAVLHQHSYATDADAAQPRNSMTSHGRAYGMPSVPNRSFSDSPTAEAMPWDRHSISSTHNDRGTMPGVHDSYASNSSGLPSAGAVANGVSHSPRRQGSNLVPSPPCNPASRTAGGHAIDYSSLSPALAAMHQLKQGRAWHYATLAPAGRAADEVFQGFGVADRPLSHAGSGCSSHSSGGGCGGWPTELALMRGLSCDSQMEDATAGINPELGEGHRKQHRLPHRNISGSSSSSKQGGHQPAHEVDRQASLSSYASDDTMETVASGGLALTTPAGLIGPASAPAGITGLTTPSDQPELGAGMTNPGVAAPATSGIAPGQRDAATGVNNDSSPTPDASPTKRQASLQGSLELICEELKHLRRLKSKLARAAAAAPAGSAPAAACNLAQARNNETIQQAMAAKAALETAMYGGLDSIGETDQDMLVE